MSDTSHDFQRPILSEVWWVAVQGATDPSGGWIILADEGQAGASAIQETFAKARIPILAAVDATSLEAALKHSGEDQESQRAIIWMGQDEEYAGHAVPGSSAQALVSARLEESRAHIVLSQSQQAVRALSKRLATVPSSISMEGVRMDLRSPPRGQGSWGLTLFQAKRTER